MRAASVVALVARREVIERTRQRSFLISTAITATIVVGLALLPLLLGDGPDRYDVGVVGDRADELAEALDGTGDDEGAAVEARVLRSRAEAEGLVSTGTLDAVLVDGTEVVVEEDLADPLRARLEAVAAVVSTSSALAEAGVDPSLAATLLEPQPLDVEALDPVDDESAQRGQIVFFGVFLLYGQLVGYGYAVASGVVEEKTSRVVEIILAKVRPAHLLAGKIVGIGVVGMAQLLALVTLGLGTAVATGSVDLPPGMGRAALEVLAWFGLGYAFYSCAFAVAGALASRSEELQNTSGVLNLVVIASFLAAVFGVQDPDGVVMRVASFLPPSAPLTMPLRTAVGAAEVWEVAVAVAATVAGVAALVPLAGRVYRGGALRTRRQVSLKEAWRGTT